MIRNYFKVAFRTLWRNKTFSAINILGLALGLACSLLIFLWVRDEVSVNKGHANGPQLYALRERQIYDGKRVAGGSTPGLIALEMPKRFPEIVRAAGFSWQETLTFSVNDKINKESGCWAGADWFRMFSIPLLAGSAETALKAPNGIAISRKVAELYFGTPQTALGKAIRVDAREDYMVTAVFENLPANEPNQYDFLLSWDDFLKRNSWAKDWGNNGPFAYLQLRPDANVAVFQDKIRHFLRAYSDNIDPKNLQRFDIELFLQPFEETYLYSDTDNGEVSGGRIEYVRLFSVVAVFLLLIACINFMNLATARSVKRAKEVGIRKVVGAERARLIGQFIGEALLLSTLAVIVAVLLVWALLPLFNEITGKRIDDPLAEPSFGLMLVGVTLVTGVVAGSYPALFLSSLQPVRVLKGGGPSLRLKFKPGATLFRQGLVVVQFVLSMVLIIGTVVVYQQVNFIQTQSLGFDRENLLYVPLEGELIPKYATLKQELLRKPGIQAISRMGDRPSSIGSSTGGVGWTGKDPNVNVEFMHTPVGYDFGSVLKAKMLAGRDFSPAFATDSVGYIINEQAARRIGYKNPIDQPLSFWGKPGKIIGVIEDFHFQSLREPIQPLILRLGETNTWGNLLVRTQPGQTKEALASLEQVYKALNPKFPFTYQFADDEYQRLYQSEQLVSQLANYFAFLAIFIACLGLFGLAAFTAEQRTKEIGVRKVLGASVTSIVGLLSKDFLRLVLIAIVVATPVAWWAMSKWLQNYEYHIDMQWWMFVLAGSLAVLIAFLTVSFQSIKAALMNPVKSLRSE
ncbi:ABC transporter permease [Larkinella sp. VNQ87]|uniref:ABC transporter permease n=1 Tax=Larkinella sp. VNQ87 TaxID=3400921 RepID=UPI003BFA98C2